MLDIEYEKVYHSNVVWPGSDHTTTIIKNQRWLDRAETVD